MAGRLKSFLAVVYQLFATPPQPSDEVKVAALPSTTSPSPVPDSDSDSVTVPIPNPSDEMNVAAAPNNGDLHPAMRIAQEQDLSRLVASIGVPIVMAILLAGKSNFYPWQMNFVLILLCVGIAGILCGFVLRNAFPNFAQIGESMGTVLVTSSFFTIIAFFLPPATSWVPIVCLGAYLLCFIVVLRQPPPLN